jgi:hypothetical protein
MIAFQRGREKVSWTDYHAKLAACELTQRFPIDNENRLAHVLVNAQVDTALFAFNTPFNRGSLLADEANLGKTIEAGIIISRKWAERRRKILIILSRGGLRKTPRRGKLDKPCLRLGGG